MDPRPQPSQQGAYRVEVTRDELALVWKVGSKIFPVRILDLSSEAVSFHIESEERPEVHVGDPCQQVFWPGETERPIEVGGEVLQCVEEGDAWVVTVSLSDRQGLADALAGSDQWKLFNRRRAFRVQPRSASFQPAQANLQWTGFCGDFVIHDVSEGGLAIRIAHGNPVEIPTDKPVRVQIEDPLGSGPIEFVVRKCHEDQRPSHRRVGFVMDSVRTVYRAEIEDRLVRAVLHWQRNAIQARAKIETHLESVGPVRRTN